MFQAKASNERLDVVKSLIPCKLNPGASICAFVVEMKGYLDRLESLNMVFDGELSINIILSSLPSYYNQFVLSYQMNRKKTSIMKLHSLLEIAEQRINKINVSSTSPAPVLIVGYNAKKRNTSHSNLKGNASQGKSNRGSKRKAESKIAPTSNLKEVGLKESRRLKHGELNLVMGNSKITPVTRIGKYELVLKSGLSHPRTPQLNSVAERRNRTQLDMVRSMMCRETLPICLWGYALETTAHILNLVPTKKVSKTPFKMWKGKRHSLGHIKSRVVRTSSRVSKTPQFYYGFHIKDDKISDSTLSELDEPANYKEAMAIPEAAKWKEAMKNEIQSMYENQMDVKTTFLNQNLTGDVFMAQPKGFENANEDESYIYVKVSGSVVVFLVLYVDDILLIGNNIPMLQSVKDRLGKCFAMKDLVDSAYILGIKIYRDRPDVSFALSMVSQHQQNPGEGHWTTIKNILKYLRNTKDKFLVCDGEEELRVTVLWKSSKQDRMADSTCQSKYIVTYEASKEAIWIKNFIGDLGVVPTVQDPIEIIYDNESAVALTKEPKDYRKSKHIEIKYHFVRSKVEEGHVIVKDIRSEDNLAAPFTKALAKSRHNEQARSIGLKDKIKF
uniref:Reverse transcriptase Ty1/copia-type domain-containing protein n=1 Tax=Tanacetum cinerariifolium TaxID=118510 RepID=A0A6L2KLR0_TANCI|nr:hypothetical protein [Tanacetum cinerariifolium]